MPKFLNLISQSGKDEYVDISEFNKNPNAYGKYKIRMVDDATGKNYNIPATMFGEAQKDGLRAWNMEKQTTKQKQVQNPQPKTAPSYQDMLSGDYWSKQLGAKQEQDILPTQEKAGLDLPNLGGQEGYVDRTMDVLYNEQKRFAKSQAEMERIQKELGDANKRAEALKKQISEENQRRQDTAHVPTYGGFYAQLPQNSNYTKQLEEEQKNIAQLSKQLNENEYYQRNLRRLEETARGLSTEGALEAQQSDAQMPWYANPFLSSNQRVGATINQPNEKQRQASTILENVKQTRRLLREASLSDDSWYNKLGRGLADAARDINTWDSGVNAVNNALSTLNAKRGFDQGKATAADKAVLESAAIRNVTSQKTKDAISAWYNAGITTTNMVPFMAQIVSSPFNNVGRGLSSAISKMLTQTAQGALLQRMLPQVVYRAAVNGMKGIGRFAGDVAGGAATALTFANQKMLADAANRYQGQHTGQFTADGRFEYTGSEKAKGKYQALLEAFATQAIEYQSELVGEYFTPLNRLMAKGLGKSVGYGTKEFYDAAGNKITSHFFGLPGHKISLDKTIDLFSRLSNAEMIQAFNKFTKATKFNGVIGEYLEEVVGNMENATLGINDANWGTGEGGVFNPKENMETFLAVAVGSGFMAGMAGPVGLMHKASINRAYNRANADGIETFNLSAWQAIRDQIDYAPVPELPNVVLNIMNGMNDNQKRVVQNYAAFSVAKQGSLMSEFKDQLEKPHVSHVGVTVEKSPEGEERYFVTSSDEQYNVLQKREFKTEEEANAYVARVDEYIKNGRNLQVLNQLLSTVDGTNAAIDIALDMSEDLSYISELFYTDPLRRSDAEQAIVDEFVNRANGVAYPSTEVNEPHETQNGQDLADGAPIGDQATIDTVNQREANAISHWNEVADPDLQNTISIWTDQGIPSNEIVENLRYNEYSEEIISAFCELCNAKAEKDGFMSRTGQRIEEQVNQRVQQVTFAGLLNGEESPIILQVQDQNGVPGASMYIVSGNISMDEQGTLTSDGLIILRDEQGNFIQRPDTNGLAIVNTQNAEDYRNQLLTQTQEAVTAQIQTTEYKAPEYNDSDMEAQAPEAPQGSGLTAPQPTTPPADTNEQQEPQQEPEPAIPTDENGNLLYHKAPIEATILDLYNGELDDEEIRDFVQNKINESSKEYDKANKKKPKIGTDKNAYLQAKTQWQSQVDEAKQQLDYWNSVQNYIQQQTHTTPEEIKAAQDELSGTTARLEYARQAPEGATTPEQIAGEFVKNAKIQPEDFYRETGLTAADARKQYPGMLSNNGATIASLAEQLVQYDNDNYGGMFFKGDDMEARNYIIETLKNAPSRKSLGRNMTAEEQEYVNQYEEQREAFYQEAYGMSYSDYLAFEEQEMPNIWRRISNFAPEQYDQMVAEYYESLPEDYFTPQNEQQNGTEGQQDNRLADSTTLLPQSPTDNETGSGQRQDSAAETGTGIESDNQNEEVPGGTQGVGKNNEPQKKNSASDNTTDTDETVNNGKLNDTATQQNTVSEGKDTTKSPTSQENQQKTDKKSDEGQQEDEIAAEIKKDIEDFIAKSTHDVQITNYDEKEFEAQISVDGKPSNIVITPPMELGEAMHAEYRPTEGGYQELGDLLDEYNEGLEPKEQGFDGEHLAAIFSSVDAAIAFEKWLNQKNNPNDWENLTEEQKAAAIDADTIADENAKELAKDFLIGDNTSTIAEVFYREIVGRYMANEETPKKKEEKKKDNPLDDSIKDIQVVDAPFPKDISEDSILSKKHNKSGRRDSTYSATIGIKGNDLYVKTKNLKTSQFVVKDALSYNASLIALRLEYAGITTDEARLLSDMVLELYNQKGLAISTAPTLKPLFTQKPKPSNVPPVGQAESGKPKAKPREEKPKTETPPTTGDKSDVGKALDEFKDVMARFRQAGRTDANVSLIGLNSRQIEMLGEVFRATAKLGYALIKSGTTTFENWLETMKAQVSDIIKANSNWNDQDITELLTETWNNKYLADGERKPLSQWAAEEALAAEQKQEEQKQEEEQPAETPETPAAEKRFPFTKQQLEGMTKQQMIDAMWHEVFPRVCEMYKLPSDILDENAYWFAPRMTTGYDKDSLVSACMKYMEHLYDEVQPATEKQMNYIMKLAAENEKKLFKDITLTRTAASRVIDLLKSEEEMIYSRSTKQDDFEEVYNELEKIARLNGADLSEKDRKMAERKFVDNLSAAFQAALETGEKPYASITALRKAAREAGMEAGEKGETDIKIQELVEDALVSVARGIMRQARIPGQREIHKFRKETFEKIKLLYNLQPTISMRSSNRVALQQYSTPLPMAFVADMFATGRIMRMFFSALEPTAGNGMLVFGIDAKRVHVNEIDENRLENLRGQGFKEVTSQDATEPFKQDQYYDAIITNPPFGEAEAKDYDGYKISGLAPQIALNALSKMRDFGKAVIIIGGKQEFAPNGAIKNDKPFLTYLYNHYNVKGVIDMEGSLYAKQGTTFPTRMILIDGRRTDEERAKSDVYPPTIKDWLPKADSFDKLYDTVKSLMESKEKTNGTEIVHAKDESLQPDRGVTLPGNTDKRTDSRKPVQDVATTGRGHGSNRGNGKDSKRDNPELDLFRGVLGGSGGLSDKPAGKPDSGGGSGRRAGRDNGPTGEGRDNRLPVVNDVPGIQGTTTRGVGLTQEQENRKLDSEKLPYRPHNGAFSLESLAPAAMVEAMDKTLKRIEEEYGNIDEFVTNELGYISVDAMHKALAAEQVDSVAMAIYNMKKGEALIIGDQTGVGKGRQMAALIRWARRQGKKPIFMTQKSNLFNDIYRDLKDIGSENLKPFIFNGDKDAKIVEIYEDKNGDEKQKTIYKNASDDEINEALKSGKIPDDCDFVLCTYSQISTGDETSKEYENQLSKEDGGSSKRRRSRKQNPDAKPKSDKKAVLLRKLAKDNYLMLDESHTAAGESNQGFYMQTLVRDSKAVTFASATYAKRPDTMPLYALRTAMSKANIGMQKLIEAIQKGGVTLQEIMSRALTNAGQMIRRERDMEGVVTDWTTIDDPQTVKKARENYDKTIKAFNAIIDFQNKYIDAFINNRRESLAEVAGNAGFVKGTEKMGIDNTPFASKAYNYTKQLMLALKVDAIVDEVDKQIKAGKKPVIALDNTMGALFDKLTPGEEVTESTFAENLLRGLDTVMQYSQDNGRGGKKISIKISPSELGLDGEAAYYELVSFIKESTKDIFISPLDEITAKLRAKGYTVGELTGRKNVVVEDNGTYRIAKRKKLPKQLLQSRFNSGKIDVVILNKTGSTGISLHASKTFADQRQRVMILAQPLPDINDYMQMIGRIDRTGQVKRGYYINLGLPVPAEQRFLMMLSTKLKSLNANTTTSQESKDNKVEAPDMLNKYGSQVIVEYFKDHPDVYNKLDDPLNVKNKAGGLSEYKPSYDDEDARKLTGQVALLSTDEQQAFYDDVIERYNNLIKYLDDSGTNDLKITSLPLNATTLARAISSVGNDPTGDNPFAQNAYVEKVEMDVLRKPMKASEIKTVINTINKGKDPKQAVEDIKTQYENEYKEKLDKQKRKYEAELERNKETLKKFEDKINGNEKMPEEDKKKAIEEKKTSLQQDSERKNENAIGAIEFDHERMVRDLDLFKVGSPYLIPDNLDSLAFDLASPGIFLGFKAKENGITPSSTVAVFATLDGRRRVEVKLSERGRLNNINETTNQNYDAAQEVNLSNWDSNIPNITRKTGYIITGNILQAINDSQDENGNFTGQLVSYTDSEGNIHDGVLMPDKWEPTMLVNAGKPIASAREDIERGRFVRSINGEVEIYTDRHYGVTTILLRVPKSKKLGAKYYENEDLRNAIDKREFYQKSGKFQVAIPNGKLDEVLSVLSSLGVKVPSDVVKQLNENSQQDNNSVGKKYSEDNTINSAAERFDIKKGYNSEQLKTLPRDSYTNRNGVYIVGLKEYIERLRDEKSRYEKKNENTDGTSVSPINDSAESKGEGTPAGRYGKSQLQGESETNTNAPADSIGNADSLDKGRSQYNNDKSRRLDQLLDEAEAEDKKRVSRAIELRNKYDIDKDGRISRDNLSKMLRDFTNNKDYIALFEKLMDDIEHLGIDIRFEHALGKAKGETSIFDRTVSYSLDYFARDVDDADKATVIIHELLHQELQSTIDAYNSVVFRGSLNSAQREAVSELNKIFDALKKEMPRNKNGIPFYGTKSVHEMVSELTDNEFREVLSNLQYNKKSMLQRIIDCIKRIIGLPVNEEKGNALDATSRAVQTLIENYNPSFDRNWRDKGRWIIDHIEGLANKLDYSLASEVDDKAILDKLNSEPTVKVYRAMQVIDGKLYPPMAAKVGGSLVEPTKPGTWYQADEHPELIIQDGMYKDGTPKYVFKLDKGGKDATGKKATDVKAAYNPYWHTSRSPLNDQFKSAWIRPNLITVEVEVPESELTSGYKAQYAKDAVGEVEWKSGSVSGKLAKLGNPRKVILSRYNKVVRVVPESEIADRISEMLSGTDITIPENVVTPKLRSELEKKGVSISEPEKGVNKNTQIEEALAAGLETDNSLRYRKVSDSMQKPKTSEEEKSRMTNSAISLAESINTPIKVISAEEAPEGAKNSKGYYDTRTGEVTIVLDNNTSPFDVQRTVAHEIIGHKGLRGLLGTQNYYKIMNAVYDNLPQDEKDKINEAARRNGWQMYTAMDEYLAEQAENMVWDAKSASLWQNVKHYLTEALRTLGFIVKPNLKDARYWLWLSKNQLKRGNVMSSIKRNALLAKLDKLGLPEQKVEEQDHLGEPRYAFSNGNYVDSAAYDAIEQNLKSNSFYWKEAFIDYMQAYQVFQNEMAKGLKNGLMDNQNALIGENALTSTIEQQQSDYMRMQLKPLQDIIKKLQPEFGEGEEGIRNIENYLMMKHGLERNRVLFMRDWFKAESERKIKSPGELSPEAEYIYERMEQAIWQDFDDGNIDEKERDKQIKEALTEAHLQYLSDTMAQFNRIKNDQLEYYEYGVKSLAEAYQEIDDFINQHAKFDADKQDKSGLTALKEYFSGNKYEDAAIIDQVQSYDDMLGGERADKLMQAVQTVTQFALDEDYKNGLVTKEGYNRAKNMFRYYIPLRGFDETTMEDVYEYMTYSKGTGAKSLVHAKGRTSKAGSPLATAANMALNAIARGLRNQNKQRAYRLVNTWLKDNPTSVPPAIVTDLWVGLDASGNDTVFTPDITDDMTAEEIRNEIEKFKDKMRIMEELGKASKVRSEASFRHRFSSDNHKNEHIVPLMINGRAKMIVFNGNPRPAQALRGDLAPTVNKEFGLDKIMGRINRVMAGAFTSYNPTFMATNLLRDTGFANNNIAVKEGGEYYAKFLKNQAALLTKNIGKYAKLKWDYDKGIAPRNEMEQYFHEFMKNGGKTGFVNQQDIAKLEKLLAENNQNFSSLNAGTVIAKYTVNAIKAANDRIENINRFAVYMTSRQIGRSVMRSIYDAKEVSVNFNRKGAAGNTGRTPNATASMKLAANLASFTRGAYLFFNAGVQSLNLLSKNIKGHPIKSAAYIVGIPMLLGGFVFPMLNQIIAEAAGDGDDDPYANLPEWTRRNNICIYLTHGVFLKIPLPIELRAFYGLGDIAAGYLVNEHLKSEKNVALDVASQLTQILPVDFLGEGGSVTAALTPDAMKPMIQIATNTDWTGKPIYKDSEWNKYEPEYTKAFKNEFEPFINLSKFINEAAGGSDHVRSDIEGEWNNPAIWHAVIQGYGGGAVMDVVRVGSLSRRLATMDSKGLTTKEVPIVKAIFETPSEKTQYYRMLNKFYSYQEKNEKFKHDLKALSESASPLDHAKYLHHTDPNKPSPELVKMYRFKDYDKTNRFINNVLKNPKLSETEREAWEEQAVKLKVNLVKILDQIED